MIYFQRIALSIVMVATIVAGAGCKKEGGGEGAGAKAASAPKVYAETAEGLKELMTDLSAAASGGDPQVAQALAAGLALKDAPAWFKTVYGDAIGKTLAEEYAARNKDNAAVVKMMVTQKAKGRTEFTVEKFEDPKDPGAVAYQEHALASQQVKTPLYSFRATEPGKPMGQHLYNFVWAEGGWRLVGPMKMLKPDMLQDKQMDAVGSLRARDREEFFKSGTLPGEP